jgi:hypothetical protein
MVNSSCAAGCADTIDNDQDGQIDCQIETGNCDDAIDDDGDGLVDCDDQQCTADPAC